MLKRWTSLGVAAALVVGCSQGVSEDQSAARSEAQASPVPNASSASAGESGAGEAGAGERGAGESGEGGVDVAAAATDPVAYLSALAVTEAHIRAAIGALKAGERQAAGEMFAHPVSEVLLDLEPTFKALGVAPFDSALSEASTAVFDKKPDAEIEAKAEGILKTLSDAGAKAPKSDKAPGTIAAAVIADQIERAAQQYLAAKAGTAYEPYLDGYGFLQTAKAWQQSRQTDLASLSPAQRQGLDAAIKALELAYPGARRPTSLQADTGALLAASSQARLGL
jgi:hypothetical protein